MTPVLTEVFGNASSIHSFGQHARHLLDAARRQVAMMIGARPEEIVFTSGGTEADNAALFSFGRSGHVITTTAEHSAILQACAQLRSVTTVPVDRDGLVNPDDIRGAIRPDTRLVSVMHVNNELGVIQPIEEIARIAHDAGALFHSDGVQAVGKVPVQMGDSNSGIDLYSMSAHKIYGPKGVGALFVRKGTAFQSLLYGGPHENKKRAGTENVAGAVGFGRAAEWVMQTSLEEAKRQQELRDRLEAGILSSVAGSHVNAAGSPRVGNTSNMRFDGVNSEPLLIALDLRGFAVSSGSACSSGATEPSHVLAAIGLTREQAQSSIRFSLGRSNTVEQVDALIDAVAGVVAHVRKMAPAYK